MRHSHQPHDSAEPVHDFDQTNGMATDLEGDSDGTAESDTRSAEDRRRGKPIDPRDGSTALFHGHGQ